MRRIRIIEDAAKPFDYKTSNTGSHRLLDRRCTIGIDNFIALMRQLSISYIDPTVNLAILEKPFLLLLLVVSYIRSRLLLGASFVTLFLKAGGDLTFERESRRGGVHVAP
uniref:hypothetical protein n=1 Tax=Jatropha curcas TaxID=180498 RepID=UPI0027A30CB5|nr:hypothetical protein QLP06_mgp072 [Jatropha curcas]WFG81167.1 hypothetical protein [Jatropha curcas]